MFAKITNEKVDKYPYTIGDLRKDNPNTSFPKNIPNNVLAEFGVFPVGYNPAPEYNSLTQRLEISSIPVFKDGSWKLTKTIVDKTQEQIAVDAANKAASIRKERNKKLTASDWTQVADVPVDKTAWAIYRQALRDVTVQEGFPHTITWPTQPE